MAADSVRGRAGVLAVVVVNYGSHRLLEHALAGHQARAGGREIVVVDNWSSAAELAAVRDLGRRHGWHVVASAVNGGFGAAVNLGVAEAARLGCEAVLLLNPDARVDPHVVAALHEQVRREPDVAVAPRIVTPEGAVEFRGAQVSLRTGRIRSIAPDFGDDGRPRRIDGQLPGQVDAPVQGWLSAACLAMSLSLFERCGGMAEDYFLYWEDVDLSRRIERVGGGLLVRQDLVAVHSQGGTQPAVAAGAMSATYYRYNAANRLRFAALHLPRRRIAVWMLRTPAESAQILLRGGRRQLLRSPAPLLAIVRGSLAGLAIAACALLPRRRGSGDPRAGVLVAHPGAELYGSDRMVLETVSALAAGGRPVTVVLPDHGPLAAEIEARGARVRTCRMPVLRRSALRPRGFVRLLADAAAGALPAWRLVRTAGRGGVYVNTLTLPSWLLVARMAGVPATCHVHEAERAVPVATRRVLAAPLLLAGRIVANSEYTRDVLVETLPALGARTRVVHNLVVGPAEVPAARRRLDGPVQLLYAGRLSPRKGVDVAVRAVASLARRGLAVELTVLGATFTGYEWYEREVRELAAGPDTAGRVRLLGFEASVWPRLAAADIVLVPSVGDESFGNAAVEAVLAARPSVVSDIGGLREAASGYRSVEFVAPGDVMALADAVARIADEWISYAAFADTDAVQARRRHDPSRYRHALVMALDPAPLATAGSR